MNNEVDDWILPKSDHRSKAVSKIIVGVLNCSGLKANQDLPKLPYYRGKWNAKTFESFRKEVLTQNWYKPQTGRSLFESILAQNRYLIQNNPGNSVSEKMYGTEFSSNRGALHGLLCPDLFGKNTFLFYKIEDHYKLSFEDTFLNSESDEPRNQSNSVEENKENLIEKHILGKAVEAFLALTENELIGCDQNNKRKEELMDCNNITNILTKFCLNSSNYPATKFLMASDVDLFAELVEKLTDLEPIEVKSIKHGKYVSQDVKLGKDQREKWTMQMNAVNCKRIIIFRHNDEFKVGSMSEKSLSNLNAPTCNYVDLANIFYRFKEEYEKIKDKESIHYLRITVDENGKFEYSDNTKIFNQQIITCIQKIQESMKLNKPDLTTTSTPPTKNQNKTKQNKTKQNKTKQNKTKQNKTNLLPTIAENDKKTPGSQHSRSMIDSRASA